MWHSSVTSLGRCLDTTVSSVPNIHSPQMMQSVQWPPPRGGACNGQLPFDEWEFIHTGRSYLMVYDTISNYLCILDWSEVYFLLAKLVIFASSFSGIYWVSSESGLTWRPLGLSCSCPVLFPPYLSEGFPYTLEVVLKSPLQLFFFLFHIVTLMWPLEGPIEFCPK